MALAFGEQLLDIETCIGKFETLVQHAFTARIGQFLMLVREVELFVKKSKYETTPLTDALRIAFPGDTRLFGPPMEIDQRKLKVAVTLIFRSTS